MANQEQEINQPSDTPTPATDTLAAHTPDETNAPSLPTDSSDTAETPSASTQPVEAPADLATEPVTDDVAPLETSAQTPAADVPADEPVSTPEATGDVVATDESTASTELSPAAEIAVAAPAELPGVDAPGVDTADASASEQPADAVEVADAVPTDEISAEYANVAETDEADEAQPELSLDYSQFSREDFVQLLETQLAAVSKPEVTPGDFKKADQVLKESKPPFDQMKRAEREAAMQAYVAETGAEEGFAFKQDDTVQRYDDLYKQIKSLKNTYFQNLDKAKDGNFAAKTDLLTRLRELVETDESNAGDPKTSWNEFKKIQDEWKAAGNMNSPHNATLWATYHALVDRYYSNRNIYFELKDLDRKRNVGLKTEVIEKVEAMVKASEETPVTRQTIDEANALFEEYKHIGPAPKAEQEVLWGRMKAALDVLYDKRRGQTNEQRKESAQLYEEKSAIYEELVPITSFTSSSINDWNDKTKAVMALQDRWNGIKGPMPREEGKELSKKFWAALKTFFHNKGEFFKQLESKREENLRQKTELCERVETILASGEESPEMTQMVIDLQRQWKNIGQVPEKQKNSIFDRFKAACDAFFNKKRSKNQDTDREFEANLAKKTALIERIEAAATENADLSQLNEFKKEWTEIGFVPKKDMQTTQKRYINAVNALVGATGKIPAKDKERIMQQSEAEMGRGGGRPAGGGGQRGGRDRDRDRGDYGRNEYSRGDYGNTSGNKRESDIRRRMTAIENDIATYRNNIEFFARSKNADKLRADIDQKIADAEKQLDSLRQEMRAAQE
ncbi:DUF349 domain-containing protein [Spirosoma rhododendri]|uniref:DUF349 domain-containing protein n=1 Tax=Spirosoma rhododendri TaxID=2728024 RepID=A0A7L5DME0_9BACT|nr:DUF349 domain-containing protein [Spirosoma rhododendri]QJD79629.1 DUF349 domain-containing protein [Spirosoma rhododendri]